MTDSHQLAAVGLHGCRALLLAGPGCGKTHILARRVFHANTVCGVPFEEMLCLTFTNRAAREMTERVRQCLAAVPTGLFAGTLHSFCLRFLRVNGLISPDTSIIDEEDVADYLASPHDIREPRAIKDFLDMAAYVYQLENEHPDPVIRRPCHHPTEDDYARIDAYVRFKEENKLIDYDDILRMTFTALLDINADMLEMTGYTWLQVDEVQDMTPLQLAIIDKVCAGGHTTALYLGDEQQAIFGFLGAGGRALDMVKRQCGANILRLQRNYRSPGYLVNLCNRLARHYLGIAPELLPKTSVKGDTRHPLLSWTGDTGTLLLMAASQARRLLHENPEENTVILVHTNRQGQDMANLLSDHGFDFFHVSRKDIFHQAAFKTVWAHLAVVQEPSRNQEWARLLYQTRSVGTLRGARQLVNLLGKAAMSGEDLLYPERPTAIERFSTLMEDENSLIVVIDTETTGLDVAHDDVVQIAAIKLRGGKAEDRFCVYIRTEQTIPRFLADSTENPMRRAYAEADLLEAEEAFERFAEFIGEECIPAGHNAGFDMDILRHNIERRTSMAVPKPLREGTKSIDTMMASRLLLPALRKHTLSNLIAELKLEGINSHNAIDDVAATVALMRYLAPIAMQKIGRQAKIRDNINVRKASRRFSAAYGPLYRATKALMQSDSGSLGEALLEARNYFCSRGYIGSIRHFDYFLEMIDKFVVDNDREPGLKTQAAAHLADLATYNESDLMATGIVKERLSVMTVHKAKGLEMDNVIVLDASSRPMDSKDYARLLYVAFSRARARLYVGHTPWKNDEMLTELLGAFEKLTDEAVAMAVREENRRHF